MVDFNTIMNVKEVVSLDKKIKRTVRLNKKSMTKQTSKTQFDYKDPDLPTRPTVYQWWQKLNFN